MSYFDSETNCKRLNEKKEIVIMKKGKILLCALLALVLGLTPGLTVSAAAVATPTPTTTPTTAPTTGQIVDADTGNGVDKMSTHVLTTGDDKDFKTFKAYYVSVPATSTNAIGSYEYVAPIKLSKTGLLICAAQFDSETHPTATARFDIYTDAACTNYLSSYDYDGYTGYKVKKAGTYYVKFQVSDSTSDGVTPYYFGFYSQLEDSSNRTLKNKQWIYSSYIDTSKDLYYKVSASKAGSITFNLKTEYSSYVTLFNSSKKAISEKVYVPATSGKAVFAVKKGTYYVKVKPSSDYVFVKSTFKAITDKSGSKKSKAKSLTVGGKAISASVLATDKKGASDWYKFTNKKTKKIMVTFTGSVSSGEIELEFFNAKGESFGTVKINSVDEDASFNPYSASYLSTSKTLPKGTYYIKVTKKSTKTSGTYSLKVK
jgi:hypothetical protein